MADVRVKICGICSAVDARAAEELGASYLGMILSQGFGRSLLPDQAVDIALAVDTPVVAVLVNESVDEAHRIAALVGAEVIQLHGEESPGFVQELRMRGDWAIWKAVRVREPEDVRRAVSEYGASVDGLLLDAWRPDRPGGGGVSFEWEDVASLVDAFPSTVEADRRRRPHSRQCWTRGAGALTGCGRRQLGRGAFARAQGSRSDSSVRA